MTEFFEHLKQRKLVQWALAYIAAAFALIQVLDIVAQRFAWPEQAMRFVIVAMAIGFFVTLVLAWYHGERGEQRVTGTELFIVALLLGIGGVMAWRLASRAQDSVTATSAEGAHAAAKPASMVDAKSVAVLPFVNTSGDPGNEYFSDGLSEELISVLSQLPDLKVIGRTSSFQFKGKPESSQVIGAALGVGYLLEGSVRKSADRVRIAVALQRSADGVNVWSQSYDRELKDIFAVQSEIAEEVAASLKAKLLDGAAASAATSTTQSVEAHNAFLKGHAYFEERNDDSFLKAIAFFDEAISLDPNYALAYAERAQAHSWFADQTGKDVNAHRATARSDADKAVALAPQLAEAHVALGWVHFFDERNIRDALAELRKAEQLAPGNAKIQAILSQVLGSAGKLDEALAASRKAVDLDPLYFYAHAMRARALISAGKLDEAAAEGRRMVELQPGATRSHVNQVVVAVLKGDGAMALREARLEPSESYRRFVLALAYQALGDRVAADASLTELIARDRDIATYQIATVYAFRGENDLAFEWLQRAYDNHDTGMLGILVDPLLQGVRADPRYATMLDKLGLEVVKAP